MKEIPLTQGKVAFVDDEDFQLVSRFRWHAHFSHGWYARTKAYRPDGRATTLSMHVLLLPDVPGMERDHINGNGLDNRRANLRYATRHQNAANQKAHSQSGYRGVRKSTKGKNWNAVLGRKGTIYLGTFHTPEEAARAYDVKAREIYGEYARLNFPSEGGVG